MVGGWEACETASCSFSAAHHGVRVGDILPVSNISIFTITSYSVAVNHNGVRGHSSFEFIHLASIEQQLQRPPSTHSTPHTAAASEYSYPSGPRSPYRYRGASSLPPYPLYPLLASCSSESRLKLHAVHSPLPISTTCSSWSPSLRRRLPAKL